MGALKVHKTQGGGLLKRVINGQAMTTTEYWTRYRLLHRVNKIESERNMGMFLTVSPGFSTGFSQPNVNYALNFPCATGLDTNHATSLDSLLSNNLLITLLVNA